MPHLPLICAFHVYPSFLCGQKTCPVCAEGDKKLVTGAACGHAYCQDCWKSYIETQINSGKAVGGWWGRKD